MTDTNEVIERAAVAIYDASGQPLCGVDKYSDHIHAAAYEKCAHDALSTLRPGDRLPNGLVVEQDWQPIETAPIGINHPYADEDASKFVLVWNGYHVGVAYRIEADFDGADEWWSETGEPVEPGPTHWKPLTAAPMLSALEGK